VHGLLGVELPKLAAHKLLKVAAKNGWSLFAIFSCLFAICEQAWKVRRWICQVSFFIRHLGTFPACFPRDFMVMGIR